MNDYNCIKRGGIFQWKKKSKKEAKKINKKGGRDGGRLGEGGMGGEMNEKGKEKKRWNVMLVCVFWRFRSR